ncbi:hypothetical protein FQN57_004388 [Myotisia sp. PD_48]|nr:hypothetical protein FQN57_004388 [Myotisia sp. PD_48]
MDFSEHLEHMASMAGLQSHQGNDVAQTKIQHVQQLFSYSYQEARDSFCEWRANIYRVPVSDAHWEIVWEEKESEGLDRELYEYILDKGYSTTKHLGTLPGSESIIEIESTQDSRASYLVKLEGPLASAKNIQDLTGSLHVPPLKHGKGEYDEEANFCVINARMKRKLESALSSIAFRPTFIRINRASKDLSTHSAAPILGYDGDTALPQYRTNCPQDVFHPTQNEYPVWYFFYGTLAEPEFLRQKLELVETPTVEPATVRGGIIKPWGGKYKALVDGPSTATADGWAYEIVSEEHEERLQYFETDMYEVVRCDILKTGSERSVRGLTFKFIGDNLDSSG